MIRFTSLTNKAARIGATTPYAGLITLIIGVSNMTKRILPSAEELHQLLRYNEENGKLYWKERDRRWFSTNLSHSSWNSKYAGKEGFTSSGRDGYMVSTINGVRVYAHRVAWAMFYGHWPNDQIDHINVDKKDNRIQNLRQAKINQNALNKKMHNRNSSGLKGIHFDKSSGKWRAQITLDGKKFQLGSFSDPEDAHAAYCKAADDLHGDFARY